jgi:Tfp pilus assembly protein PilO
VNIRTLSKRERVIVAVTLLLTLGAGLYLYLIEPLALRWLDMYKATQSSAAELAKLRGLYERREEIEKAYRTVEGAIAVGTSNEDLLVQLIKTVEKAARTSGMDVKSVKPMTAQRQGYFYRYSLQLSANSEPTQFVQFLQVLQRPECLLSAELLTVVVKRTKPSLNMTITISNLAKLRNPDKDGSAPRT